MQDNAQAHISRVALAAATNCSFEVLSHYSPYLAPSDFYVFPNLKINLHGKHFEPMKASYMMLISTWGRIMCRFICVCVGGGGGGGGGPR